MSLYAVVDNGVVTNVVVWDGEGEWSPASGEAVKTDNPVAIGWNYSNGVFINPNEPQPPTNAELRKQALSALSVTYQQDIESLNRAWLAAAVNDGVNENTKKDAVLAQINTRKTQYASDRAAIIAQYP